MTEFAIQAHNLCKTFGKVRAVRSLNLEIPRSRIYGFLGPNGSGKTTAIRMLCGLLTPTAGEINVLGYSIPDEAETLRLKVGYMTQKFSLFEDLTVAENLQFMADIYTLGRKLKKQRTGLAIERYELGSLVKHRAGTLSGGQKQRVTLSRTLLQETPILVLDDTLSAVDSATERKIIQALHRKRGEQTLLIITHRISVCRRCTGSVVNRRC